ncbi:MAG: glycosyltransferase [Candidatus Heimdallarchaeota archaeon]|nr:glycosyltransferase [Candidatus Heimdallarchaeota archaeon]
MTAIAQDYSDLTIIIPTLNEEKSIGQLLGLLEEISPKVNVIVSDDGSKDKTKEIVESHQGSVNTFFLDRKNEAIHGLTASVIDAICKCQTPYFMVMDGDLQHPPEVVPDFHEMLNQGFNLVAGNRVEVAGKWGLYRKLMSYTAVLLGRLALAIRRKNKVKDIMTGLYGSEASLWKDVIKENREKFTLEGYKVLFDFLKIYPQKLKVGYVDYVFGTRNTGESKITKKVIWLYFKSLF